ncbi:early nodulin-like protein 17 [Euphorbia peplus]|nr:early nodulin-like protein 17 [Euphorbia peplus]
MATIAAVSMAVLMVVMVPEVSAAKWTVGGNKFWQANINYTIWADGKNFYNGDWLYFVYDRNQNNVLEVNKTDYETCNSDHPLKNWTRGAGRDVVPLNETRHYYLISGEGFCYSGMKISVRVENPPPPPPPSSSPVKEKSCASPSPYSSLGDEYVEPTVQSIGAPSPYSSLGDEYVEPTVQSIGAPSPYYSLRGQYVQPTVQSTGAISGVARKLDEWGQFSMFLLSSICIIFL